MLRYFDQLRYYLQEASPGLRRWAEQLKAQLVQGLSEQRYGDLSVWRNALENLPVIQPHDIQLNAEVRIGCEEDLMHASVDVQALLRQLIPWRKGPYHLFDIHIDTEWRSDWKWERIIPYLRPLKGKMVLDVGCGNGYHCLRSYGAGAARVIGIDPSPRSVIQFLMIKHFLGAIPVDVVPVGIEQLPSDLAAFDIVMSMGVLYHRRSPMDHLRELKTCLKTKGQLVLETLVIDGVLGETLVPEGRYAKMPNVWFLPSVPTLMSWLKKCGFKQVRLVDINTTTTDEQRKTDWMTFQSLSDFLDPNDPTLTIEGHPAPKRAIIIAEVG